MDSAALAGRLLLALPGMGDPRFERAVIALITHDAQGALGIGIGGLRQGIRLHAMLDDLGIDPGAAPDAPVHYGGPVEPQRGFVLHSADWRGPGTVAAGALWAMSGSVDVLRAIAAGEGPQHFLVALGYAGWGAGQLDGELRRHGWQVIDGRADLLWDVPAGRRWTESWRSAGIDPALLSSETGRA